MEVSNSRLLYKSHQGLSAHFLKDDIHILQQK